VTERSPGANGSEQIRGAIGTDPVGRTHRAGDYYRTIARHREIEEVRRFLHRIRAMRDNDAGQLRTLGKCGSDPAREVEPLRRPDGARRNVGELIGAQGCNLLDARRRPHELVDGDANDAAGPVAIVVAGRCDRAAGGDDENIRRG
jgi:hypothetical protein